MPPVPSPARKVRFDFYRVTVRDDEMTFDQILSRARGLAAGQARTRTVNGTPVRLQVISQTQAPTTGDMGRIRMTELPPRATLGGRLSDLNLDADEGLGEETAFSYYSGLQVLVVQRNFYGVSAPSLAGYFTAISGKVVVLEPVIEPGALARLRRITDVRQFDVSVAGIHNPATIAAQERQDPGFIKMANLLEEFEAPAVHMHISMEHERGSLSIRRVRSAARRLISLNNSGEVRVKKIEVRGTTSDDELLIVDLLKDRMVEEIEVRLNTRRRLPYNARARALVEAYNTREAQLQSLFGRPEE